WQKFCLVTTDRTVVDHELQDNSTLYLLQSEDQDLPVAAEEVINFVPHYNTLIESGTFEYFAEGQKSLPCSLAELVDNSLSATAKNTGVRTIEIRLLFDKTFAVVVLDNGCGMTSKQLNNWAVYRLSKFTRENSTFEREDYTRPEPVRRSLNSDISYFGVGGKQAAFHIGNSVRMISKPRSSPDVHELALSKDEFEKKEKNKEDVYKGTILNRKVRDFNERHCSQLCHLLKYSDDTAITECVEGGQEVEYRTLVDNFVTWCRENQLLLSDFYLFFYYCFLQVTLREKPPKGLRQKNLREVQDDLQTLYINSAVDTFEFKATTSDGGSLDGILRYHPFLYDKETFPQDGCASVFLAPVEEEDDENQSGTMNRARGKRDIFECFWNGRLIPYTTVSEFDWCRRPPKSTLPLECFSRFSGVLFTNDKFRVNASKQKFMDLELKLRHKDTLFTPVFNVQKEFLQWLEKCHSQFDKQVKFLGYVDTVKRPDVSIKKSQSPWAVFSAIELDGKIYKAGDLVKSKKTQPIYYGKVNKFFLYGDHEGDVFATGGEVEITRVSKKLVLKCDRDHRFVSRLPEKLCVKWPEGNPLPKNAVIPAGTPLGNVLLLLLFPLLLKNVSFNAGSLTNLGKYTLTLQAELSENSKTSYGGRQLPSYKHKFTVKEGNAEIFTIGPLNPSLRIGMPFNIPTQMTDIYGHPTKPPPNIQPVLECSDLEVSFETTATSGNSFTIEGVKVIGEVQNYQQTRSFDLKLTLPGLKKQTQTIKISPFPGNPHSLLVKPEVKPVKVENGNPVSFNVEVRDEAGNITANAKQIVRCQVRDFGVPGLKLAVTDCSSTGTGQIVTEPINLKIINGEPQMLQAKFDMPSQKHVVAITTELKVMPSCRVSWMELFCEGEERLELKNEEKIQWQAGGVLENLVFKLYDESGKEVEVTPEIASNIKVNWTGVIDQRALIMGRLPDVQVPTKVQEERFHQVSYRDHSVSFSFTILKLVDHYDNVTNSLTSDCVTSMAVEAEGLDKSNIAFIWESSGSVKVSGVRFTSGPLGTREVCFSYGDYTEQINFKVMAGIPTKLKLLSGPEMPLQILNGTGISTPFVVQLCDEWENPSPDQRVVVETRASPSTAKVSCRDKGKAAFTVTNVKGLKKPIPGPHVNFNIIPDPNKPDKLSVNYDTSARFLAGGTFPGFKPMENDSKSCYYFRDKKIPQSVGTYTVQFSLRIEKTEVVFSNQIIVNVVANQPVKLGPECQPQIPVVSYSRDIANRTLVENMTLKIMDQYGNPTGQNLNGKVLVSIKCPDGEQSTNLPLLEEVSTVEINLKDGSTHIERLAIRESSPGENGRRYILIFKPEVVMPPSSLSPFELPFHFYNDSENQRKVSELTKKKDELSDNYEKLNKKCSLLIQNIDSLLQQNADEKKTIEDIPRRVFPMANRSGPDILGKVGHLAHISDEKAALVISWHLSSEMDCVITKTTAEAQRIFRSEYGRQQVMALDSIYVNPRSQGPLPHIKNGRELFSPVGNPLYARNLLIYTAEEESCEHVFKNILGNTILMDDIESATNYRKAVRIYCPTILTRDGNRLSASGKFGGAQNKAPHEDMVKKFGTPLPQLLYCYFCCWIELLIQFRSALEKKKDEDDKRNNTILKLSETRQEMEETKTELQEIERQLGKIVFIEALHKMDRAFHKRCVSCLHT
uniref:Structural maintenance of chromosomes flexible hinge domain containing 1 n=1 Tax=Poecilia reticulata TaxID=8081 RepID=A0A3P9NN12_POERE